MLKRFFLFFTAASAVIVTSCISSKPVADQEKTVQWPFDRPPLQELYKTPKKVFSHYFSPFPISISNKMPNEDYYAKGFLSVNGENGKHKGYGGYLRQRPLPRLPRHEEDWRYEDLVDEVKTAKELGIDGFCYDILSTKGGHWERLINLLKAVNEVGNGFKIVLMPDMMAELKGHPENLVPAIVQIADNPALYRLDDGRLVIAPYNAHAQTPEWWKKTLAELDAKGIKVAFMPLYQGWWNFVGKYADISYGFSDWGCSVYEEQKEHRRKMWQTNDRHGLTVMAPVRPQDFRPKNYHGSESHNSALFREMWQTAMDENLDWVQLITWNDYSEGSEIAPSTSTRHAFYDLSAYYTTWFKTGKQPEIVRDAIYYFYRVQPIDAAVDLSRQNKKFSLKGKPCNEIELLAFMKEPGTLEIEIGGKKQQQEFNAGINSFSVPLANGRPKFRLIRNGKTVMEKTGAWEISDKVVFDDFLVHADGGTAEVVRDYSSPRKTPPLKLKFGKVIKQIDHYETCTFKTSSGNPDKVSLPDKPGEKAQMTADGKGAFTITAGPGKSVSGGTIDFGKEVSLKPGQEIVFHVKKLAMQMKAGWIAVFLSIEKNGGGRISFTLRADQTYISSALPKFKVARGNFPVQYPAVYRIRKTEDKIEFLYNNSVMYSSQEVPKDFADISVAMSCEKEADAALMEITKIELRENPK